MGISHSMFPESSYFLYIAIKLHNFDFLEILLPRSVENPFLKNKNSYINMIFFLPGILEFCLFISFLETDIQIVLTTSTYSQRVN